MTVSVAAHNADHERDHGPGLFLRTLRNRDGSESAPVVTNIRLAGEGRKRGSALINIATVLLFALAIALYVVSIFAQWRYVMDVKHNDLVAWIEASSLDAGMSIFTLLALGLSRAGQSARIERLMIVVCALGSAAMNYEAASKTDVRSALAYTVPPIFLAAVVDRTVSVIRRHYLGDEDASAWHSLGKVGLYGLRMIAAPISTLTGARRMLLAAAPVPKSESTTPARLPKAAREPLFNGRYFWRFVVAPVGTTFGMRRMLLAATPVPSRKATQPAEQLKAIDPAGLPKAVEARLAPIVLPTKGATEPVRKSGKSKKSTKRTHTAGPSKTSQFLAACEDKHGALSSIPLEQVYSISKIIAPQHELHEGSARSALRKAIISAGQEGA